MLGALIMPLEVSAQQPLMCGNLCRTVCSTDWTARACAIETFQASRREKLLSVLAQANQQDAQYVDRTSLEATEFSVDLSASTSAGNNAIVGLVDMARVANHMLAHCQDIGILTRLRKVCSAGDPMAAPIACAQGALELKDTVGLGVLQDASAWWHGCQNARDTASKAIASLPLPPPLAMEMVDCSTVDEACPQPPHCYRFTAGSLGYVFAALAENDSSATLYATITADVAAFSANERVCGAEQRRRLESRQYSGELIGRINLDVRPRHGGSLGPETWFIGGASSLVSGSFTLTRSNGVASVFFTGDVLDPTECLETCQNGCPWHEPPRPLPMPESPATR